jgi:hypothetical protein
MRLLQSPICCSDGPSAGGFAAQLNDFATNRHE